MTDEICATDSYARSCEATVIAVDGDALLLDRTVFYARGGGQPGDTGVLRWSGGEMRITDTLKGESGVRHIFEGDAPAIGTPVTAEIDWDRRHQLMRTHTALHALSGIVEKTTGAKVTGGNMEVGGVARMDFELDAISQDFGREVEEALNAALSRDVPVHVTFMPRAEALADPDLIRTKVSLIPAHVDPIRIVDIVGIDKQADGGTHVRSTGEVGRVRVVKTESKGKGFKRMRIELA